VARFWFPGIVGAEVERGECALVESASAGVSGPKPEAGTQQIVSILRGHAVAEQRSDGSAGGRL